MMLRFTTLRAAAALAVLGGLALAGCGGGGSQSMMPIAAQGATAPSNVGTMITSNGSQVPKGYLSVTLPNQTGAASQSSSRATILSNAKKPAYIDTTTTNSSLVVSVTPQDPSEASQFGNLTVCYNLYVNGTLAAAAPPNFTYTNVGNTVTTVTLAIPAPPGTDGFQITQYAGLCGSTPFTLPTPPPGILGSSNILAQTPVTEAYMAPGAVNNLNQQIFNCTPAPAAGQPCPLSTAPNAGSTFAASVTVASVAFGTVPITNPIREQGAFLLAADKIGVPIPLEAKDASGAVIPGDTTPLAPLGGAGMFPSGVTVTTSDTVNTTLDLVDAKTGAIAQGPATSITIHEFNALSGNTTAGFISTCGTGAQSCNDNLTGLGTPGDQWVLVLVDNGVDASKMASVTVTATATVANAALATPITTVITPQSAVFSAGGTGYADLAAPAAPIALIQPVAGGAVYFTDGATIKTDGVAGASGAAGTTLTGLTYAAYAAGQGPGVPTLYAVDNAATGAAGGAPSGLYAYAVPPAAATAVVTQDGAGNPVQFKNPVGAIYAPDLQVGKNKVYVIDGNGIEPVDVNATFQATSVLPLNCTGTAFAAAPTGVKLFGTVVSPNAGQSFIVADPGNNRIAQVAVTGSTCVIATYASGAAFTGITSLGGGALYATSSSGQIYYISGSGATPVPLGLTTATVAAEKDGPIGQLSALGAAPTGTLSPVAYLEQLVAGSFFNTAGATTGLAAPYTLAPFNGTQAFTVAPNIPGLVADTSAAATATAGTFDANGGLIVVPTTAGAAATVTPDSILFVDGAGGVTSKLRTVVR
jgi:hypothetical protein